MTESTPSPLLPGSERLVSSTYRLPRDFSSAQGKREADGLSLVLHMMEKNESITFDEARLRLVNERMAEYGIDPSGVPMDPKAFTFDRPAAQTQSPNLSKQPTCCANDSLCSSSASTAEGEGDLGEYSASSRGSKNSAASTRSRCQKDAAQAQRASPVPPRRALCCFRKPEAV